MRVLGVLIGGPIALFALAIIIGVLFGPETIERPCPDAPACPPQRVCPPQRAQVDYNLPRGDLHALTMADWRRADVPNRLGTALDIVAKLTKTVNVELAAGLVECLDKSISGLQGRARTVAYQSTVAEFSVTCLVLMNAYAEEAAQAGE